MKQKLLYILLFIFSVLAGTGDVLAQKQYYVLETETGKEYSVNDATAGPFELSGRGAKLTFSMWNNATNSDGREVVVYASDASLIDSYTSIGKYNTKTGDGITGSDDFEIDLTKPYDGKIKFVGTKGTTWSTKRIKNVKVTRASLLIPTPSSITCEAALGKSISQPISIEYSNTNSAGNIKISHIRSKGDANVSFNVSEIDVSQARFGDVIEAREGTVGLSASFSAAAEGTHTGIIKLEHFSGSSTADYTEEIPYTFKITPKPQPSITFFDQEYYPNHVYSISKLCSSTNTDIPLVTTVSGDNAVVIGDKLFILSTGNFTITAEQDESDDSKAVSLTKNITVDNGDFGTPELKRSSNVTTAWNGDDVTIALPGPCQEVSFDLSEQLAANGSMTVSYYDASTNGWNNLVTNQNLDEPKSLTLAIPRTAIQLKFSKPSTLKFYAKNITYHMAAYMIPSSATVTMNETMLGNPSTKGITVDWSDADINQLTTLSDNPNFSATIQNEPLAPANSTWGTDADAKWASGSERWGRSTMSVQFSPQTEGTHSGYIYFHDNKRFTRIKVSGTAYSNHLKLQPTVDLNTQHPGQKYPYVTLNRTLNEGYSTLTLPFDTDISELSGYAVGDYVAQLSLVTYNAADGYTLFFKKVAEGVITAHQPYVIYRTAAMTTYPQWINCHVYAPQTSTVSETTDLKGWKMTGNYTPGFSMSGKYGIANGKLALGGASSTLNAYTAYFEPPTNGENIRTRVAIMDDDGNATYIGEIRDGRLVPEAIYGADGIPQTELKNGINIVRTKDGTVRKIWKR